MKRYHCASGEETLLWVDDAEPECEKDFCVVCGTCLHCYSGYECSERGIGRGHIWVVYETAESLAQHNAEPKEATDAD